MYLLAVILLTNASSFANVQCYARCAAEYTHCINTKQEPAKICREQLGFCQADCRDPIREMEAVTDEN